MASVTFAVDEELQSDISKFSWINLSELVKQELITEEKTRKSFEKFKSIVSKSKLTEKDADKLSNQIKGAMLKELKDKKLL
jgi:hypothetical protein